MTNYPTKWERHDPRARGVYGDEAKCYEHAVFELDRGALQNHRLCGSIVKGYPSYTGRDHEVSKYGLVVMVRQVKEYVPRAKRAPENKQNRSVRIEQYDKNGNLIDLTVETRMVYTNTKGEYIKTRSEGNPRITYVADDGTRVIRKETRLKRWRGAGTDNVYERWSVVVVTPEEWSKKLSNM